jgi:hypothetical protein
MAIFPDGHTISSEHARQPFGSHDNIFHNVMHLAGESLVRIAQFGRILTGFCRLDTHRAYQATDKLFDKRKLRLPAHLAHHAPWHMRAADYFRILLDQIWHIDFGLYLVLMAHFFREAP